MSWNDSHYRPGLPDYAKLPFVDQTWITTEALERKRAETETGHPWPRPLTLNDYKDTLRLTLRDVMTSLDEKNAQTWDYSLTSLLGTTGAAIGALAGKTGLTNVGIGTAAGGQIAQNHYTPDVIRSKHLDAHRKLSCISTEIGNLSEFQRRWAMESTNEDGRVAASESMFTIAHAVDGVLSDYRLTLLGMSPPTQTTQDMIRFLEAYKTQAVVAQRAASAAGVPAADVDGGAGAGTGAGGGGPPVKPAAVDQTLTITGVKEKPLIAASGAGSPAAVNTAAAAATGASAAKTTIAHDGRMPDEVTDPRERLQYVAAGNRYAVRFVTLSVRLEACRRLGTP